MKTVDLKDKRLNRRLGEVLSQLASRPTASIPTACGGNAETAAAYRLFDNEKTNFDNVLQPHVDATRHRMAAQAVVLLVQDTTEIDLTRPEQQLVGAGPLDGHSRRGTLLHLLHAFTPDGTPLGTVHATTWVREEDAPSNASQLRSQRAATPIEDKESHRWVLGIEHTIQEARRYQETRLISIADSEADIYEVLAAGAAQPGAVDWIVRACQNRALQPGEKAAYVREQILREPPLFTHTIHVRGRKPKVNCEHRLRRQPRQSRQAKVVVRAAPVTLRPPWRSGRKLPAVSINVVLVSELNPPANDEPVEWMLLTSLPVKSDEQARQVVEYYCTRWMVEVFFRTLKMGCRVEDRRFEHIDRLLTCLGVYLTIAWRTLYVCRLGRACPEISCEAVFEPAEWKSVYQIVKRKRPPRKAPTLGEMVCFVAQLGGYITRRNNPPGPQTIWIGLQRLHDIALCWQMFGPDNKRRR